MTVESILCVCVCFRTLMIIELYYNQNISVSLLLARNVGILGKNGGNS